MSTPTLKLLLVEDNAADARRLQERLTDVVAQPFAVTRAASLAQALALLPAHRFDAVLLDLNLPDSAGLATLEQLQDAAPHLPLIILTGHDDEQLGLLAVQKGAQDYLVKDETSGRLLARSLQYAIERKTTQTALRASQEQLQQLNSTLEARVAERTAQAERRTRQLRSLAAELTLAEQRERQRVAQVLHDDLQQLLAAAKFRVGMLGRQLPPGPPSPLQELNTILDDSIRSCRSLCLELSPPVLYHGSFAEALHWLANWMRERHGLQVTLQVQDAAEVGAKDLRILLFQCARELLFNVVKHAGVKEARLTFAAAADQRIELCIVDAGRGFDPAALAARDDLGGTFGLFSIRERLRHVGGVLALESQPGHGTRICLSLPRQACRT
jgi:signal transduction histidine kinase